MDISGALATGERSRSEWDQYTQPKAVRAPAASYGSGAIQPQFGPFQGGGGGRGGGGASINVGNEAKVNPTATSPNWKINAAQLHREAAELANTQTALQNESMRLDIASKKQALSEGLLREKGTKETQAREGYKADMGGVADSMAIQEKQQTDDFNAAMFGLHAKDANAMKYYINRYGSSTANVKDIMFDPTGKTDEVIVTYENGKTTKFASRDELYSGMLFFMNPKVEKELAKQAKERRAETRADQTAQITGAKNISQIREKIGKDYDAKYPKDPMGQPMKGAPDRDAYIEKRYKQEYGQLPGTTRRAITPEETGQPGATGTPAPGQGQPAGPAPKAWAYDGPGADDPTQPPPEHEKYKWEWSEKHGWFTRNAPSEGPQERGAVSQTDLQAGKEAEKNKATDQVGSIKKADGSTSILYGDGRIEIKDKDGKVIKSLDSQGREVAPASDKPAPEKAAPSARRNVPIEENPHFNQPGSNPLPDKAIGEEDLGGPATPIPEKPTLSEKQQKDADELETFVASQKQNPARLRKMMELMNQGKSGIAAAREAWGE